eukprot:EG_transcript_4694
MPALLWACVVGLLLAAGGAWAPPPRQPRECGNFTAPFCPPEPQPHPLVPQLVQTLSAAFVKVWCYLDAPEEDRPLTPLGVLVGRWQRCANKWGGASSPAMTLHLEWQRAAFDADRFRADIAGLLSLHSVIQVEVTQAVPANLTIPEPPLVIPHLLCVHFLLRLVQPHHVAPLAKGLRHAVERNATFRAAWRVVGPLAVEGDVPPVDMWQRLRTEVFPGADHTLLNAAQAQLGAKSCRTDSLAMRAVVREAHKQQVVYDDDVAVLQVFQNPDLDYVHQHWAVVAGEGVLESPFSPKTAVRGLAVGRNVFVWLAVASGCPAGAEGDHCCHATLATASVVRVVTPALIPSATVPQSWWVLHADHLPCRHCTGVWCVANGTAVIGEPTRPAALATNLSLGPVVAKWIVFYSADAVTEQAVTLQREPGWDPLVPLAVVWPLNDRIQALTAEVEDLEAQVQAREEMVKEAHTLAVEAHTYAKMECKKMPLCPKSPVQECTCPKVEPRSCPPCTVPQPEPCPDCAACPLCPECVKCPACAPCPTCPEAPPPPTCPAPAAASPEPPRPTTDRLPRPPLHLPNLWVWVALLLTLLAAHGQNLYWRNRRVRPLEQEMRQAAAKLAGVISELRALVAAPPVGVSDEDLAQLLRSFADEHLDAFREHMEKKLRRSDAVAAADAADGRDTTTGDAKSVSTSA